MMTLKERDVHTVTFVDASPLLIGLTLTFAILTVAIQVVMAINRPINLPEVTGATRAIINQLYAFDESLDGTDANYDELAQISNPRDIDPIYGDR